MAIDPKESAQSLTATARLLADARRESRVSMVSFTAALMSAIEPKKAVTILTRFDHKANPTKLYKFLELFAPDGCDDRAPELMPCSDLETALQSYLHPFEKGEMSAEDALVECLEQMSDNEELHSFVRTPMGTPNEPRSTRDWLHMLGDAFQTRFRLGRKMYCPQRDGSTGFLESPDESHMLQPDIMQDPGLYCGLYHRSPLGQVESDYGELAARVLAVVVLAEMKLVAGGPASVHEIAFSVSGDALRNVHRYFGLVRREIETLIEARYVELHSETTTVRLNSTVYAMPEFMDEFLMYLRDEDPIAHTDLEFA